MTPNTQIKHSMISPKKPAGLIRKWQKIAAMGRKRISLPKTKEEVSVGNPRRTPVAEKGHFVVYTSDQKRFVFPLMYLNNNIFVKLLKVSEEEFGISSDGPITLPCDAVIMEYIVSLIKRGVAKGSEKAFLDSVTSSHCKYSATFFQRHTGKGSFVCSC